MRALPIDASLPEVIEAIRSHRSAVVVAPPGAGKTTRVPPAILRSGLLAADHPSVILLQPRRVAARASAARMAAEWGEEVGGVVGYQIRMERRVGPRTRIRVVTEGILARHLLADPFLEGVGAVILDEFHERSLHTDVAIAMLREVRRAVRDDLIVVAMSATMDAGPVAAFLDDAPIVRSEGRGFPVEIVHRPTDPGEPIARRAARGVNELVGSATDPGGDVLVFLPGVEEIRRAAQQLGPTADRFGLLVLPLHGGLTGDQQNRAIRPADRRKVVLATNVAETSLTIDGVRTVIDAGYARVARIDAARGLERLDLARISRASADQRAGRAGRTAPGRCVRLWSRDEHRGLIESDVPEVRRLDLAATVLALHAWGSPDPRAFGWFEAPPEASLAAAESLLGGLGALDPATGRINALGRRLLDLPLHPRLGRLMLAAEEAGRAADGATVAAILSEKDLMRADAHGPTRPPGRDRGASDILVRRDALIEAERSRFAPGLRDRGIDPGAARRVVEVRNDLIRQFRRRPGPPSPVEQADDEAILRWVLLAFPDRICRRRMQDPDAGRMVGGRGVRLDPSSVVRDAEFFVAVDPREDRRGRVAEARVRIASAVNPGWIEESFPDRVVEVGEARFDAARGRVVGHRAVVYRDLTLRESPHGLVGDAEAGAVLGEALRPGAEAILRADGAASAWLDRVAFLKRRMPEAGWPDIDAGDVVADVATGLRSLDELRRTPIVPILRGRLSPALARLLDAEAPEALGVPSGSKIRLDYGGERPVLAARLQELFGMTETPRVAGGRVPVLLHLLGPNHRPVQVTDDLRSFWSTTYFQVRKDLRSRYPRHSWPDDPLSAKPEAKGGRRAGTA